MHALGNARENKQNLSLAFFLSKTNQVACLFQLVMAHPMPSTKDHYRIGIPASPPGVCPAVDLGERFWSQELNGNTKTQGFNRFRPLRA